MHLGYTGYLWSSFFFFFFNYFNETFAQTKRQTFDRYRSFLHLLADTPVYDGRALESRWLAGCWRLLGGAALPPSSYQAGLHADAARRDDLPAPACATSRPRKSRRPAMATTSFPSWTSRKLRLLFREQIFFSKQNASLESKRKTNLSQLRLIINDHIYMRRYTFRRKIYKNIVFLYQVN